jgi:hypothetical protein
MHCARPHPITITTTTVQDLEVEIEIVAEEITGNMLCDTGDNFVVHLHQVYEIKGSHIEHVFT